MNRGEAKKCIDMAKEAFSQYDVQRARRLLNKAEKLHPSQDAKELLEEAKIYVDQHCRQILRCKNHYDVLEVPKDATTAAIKQAYKRFSLFIHPDKNESSYTDDATEAQRKLCRANEVLTDLSERRIYDSELLKEERHHQPNTNAETYESSNEFATEHEEEESEDEEDSQNEEEIFEQSAYRAYLKNRSETKIQIGQLFLMFSPVILVLIVASGLYIDHLERTTPKPYLIYKLNQEGNHVIRRRTIVGKDPYYVTVSFKEELHRYYNGSLAKLERDVKRAYWTKWRKECNSEQNSKNKEIELATLYNDQHSYNKAVAQSTPSCERFENFIKTSGESSWLLYILSFLPHFVQYAYYGW